MQVARRSWGIVAVGLLLTIVSAATAKYSGGTGEPNDPYRIATAADLIALGETPGDYDKHFILTADIDLDPNLPGRKVFDKAVIAPAQGGGRSGPRGTPFTGVFDGNSHTISHVTIQGVEYLGLFGYIASPAEIADLGVVHVKIVGSGGCIGGLAGGNGSYVVLVAIGGGIITHCYSTGAVSGTYVVGGLVGYSYEGCLALSYSTCVASAIEWGVGGLVGYCNGTVVTHCYSTGTVSGGSDVGGLVGPADGGTAFVTECFWDSQASGVTTSAGGTGMSTPEMQTASTFSCWAADGVWTIDEGRDYPRLKWEKA